MQAQDIPSQHKTSIQQLSASTIWVSRQQIAVQ